ncbi:MAG: hypothetical protein JJT94_12900 [Bernardetiaceae bacterium]|nr:hypothetical protein [Bernardetiaceae bacterium]
MQKHIITALAVGLLTLFLLFLFSYREAKYRGSLQVQKQQVDSLSQICMGLEEQLERAVERDSLRNRWIYNNYFDAYDANNFRLYALFKHNTLGQAEVAKLFNIEVRDAIKSSRVMNENWHIVPIKGLHFLATDETIGEVAKRYYFNAADSSLIQKFNAKEGRKIQKNQMLVIPFN